MFTGQGYIMMANRELACFIRDSVNGYRCGRCRVTACISDTGDIQMEDKANENRYGVLRTNANVWTMPPPLEEQTRGHRGTRAYQPWGKFSDFCLGRLLNAGYPLHYAV